MSQCYFDHNPDALTHPDHLCERWYFMNQSIATNNKINKPDSQDTIFARYDLDESVNQPLHGANFL
jgi:hypothetical protein